MVPPLPSKAWKRQLPFRQDEGLFEDEFIDERRKHLETFINKVAGEKLTFSLRRDQPKRAELFTSAVFEIRALIS